MRTLTLSVDGSIAGFMAEWTMEKGPGEKKSVTFEGCFLPLNPSFLVLCLLPVHHEQLSFP
jgi:hypothetical protein